MDKLINRIYAAISVYNGKVKSGEMHMHISHQEEAAAVVEISWGDGQDWRIADLTITAEGGGWDFMADGDIFDNKNRKRDALNEGRFEDTGSLVDALVATVNQDIPF